ncbi:MAG TPA: hypothetical protein PLP27_10670 [Crocinitomicaceae bacterium]|nr:hypothetical protein [Crocinitomicaceae bacterium]
MKINLKSILLVGATGVFVLSSCVKQKYSDKDAAVMYAKAESAFNDIPSISAQAQSGNMIFFKSDQVHVQYADISKSDAFMPKSNCNVVITIDTVGTIDTLIVDWGTSNCTCNDGKTRRGKIMTTWTGSYFDQGTIIKHIPIDYYVDDNKIEGEMVVENMGTNTSGQPFYNVNVNGTATMNTGAVINYTSERVRTFTNGYTTPSFFLDDEYDITGTANADIVSGPSYIAETVTPLHIKIGCPHITKGILDFTKQGQPKWVLDFGDGTCDGKLTATQNGKSYSLGN